MAILFTSKNCSACKHLKETTQIPTEIRQVEVETASDADIDIAIDKDIRAFPSLIQDDGKICSGIKEIQSCLLLLKK